MKLVDGAWRGVLGKNPNCVRHTPYSVLAGEKARFCADIAFFYSVEPLQAEWKRLAGGFKATKVAPMGRRTEVQTPWQTRSHDQIETKKDR